jgi:succinate dehydrogenase/fumarate reductase flavoprotein subunit
MAEAQKFETDVAIIGAGGADITAGIKALDAGARVTAFEMGPEPGGAAIISGGGCLIVGSPLQAEQGIEDSPDLAFKDWIEWGGASADQVWARYYIEHSLHDLYHWAEGFGVKWVMVRQQEGNSVGRWTRADAGGSGLMTRSMPMGSAAAPSRPMPKSPKSTARATRLPAPREPTRQPARPSKYPPAPSW